jgi:hypothetical protein
MHHIDSNRRKPAAAAVLIALLAGLLLTACGGSSKSSSSTSSAASGTKTAGSARGQFGARGAALRTCLQKSGITLPQRKPGQRGQQGKGGPFGAGGAGGGLQLPKGVTRAQLQAAFKKCGGGSFRGGGRGLQGAGGAQRFAKFSACMRKNGVNLPAPNTSGKGPIFNTTGIDTKGAAFKAADAKCVRELVPNGGPGGAQGAAPGAGTSGGAASGEGAPGGAPPSPE